VRRDVAKNAAIHTSAVNGKNVKGFCVHAKTITQKNRPVEGAAVLKERRKKQKLVKKLSSYFQDNPVTFKGRLTTKKPKLTLCK
jgi:hypothetical protein